MPANQTTRRKRWKRRLICGALLAMAVVLIPYVWSRATSSANRIAIRHSSNGDRPAEFPGRLRIIAYNIAHGRGTHASNWVESPPAKSARTKEIAQLLKRLQADIVVLNEVDFCCTWSGHENQAETIAREAGFSHWVEQRNVDVRLIYGSWQFGNAVLSKYPILSATPLNYRPAKAWEDWLAGAKRGVSCRIELDDRRYCDVVAVHLDHRSIGARVDAAKQIMAFAQQQTQPVLLAGDFNSTLRGYPRFRENSRGENAMETIFAQPYFQNPQAIEPTTEQLTFRSNDPITLIDWILVPHGVKLVRYEALDERLSDHRPVMADVQFSRLP